MLTSFAEITVAPLFEHLRLHLALENLGIVFINRPLSVSDVFYEFWLF